MATVDEAEVWAALRTIKEPEMDRDIAALNMVRDLQIGADGVVSMSVFLRKPDSGAQAGFERDIKAAVIKVGGVKGVRIGFDGAAPGAPSASPPPGPARGGAAADLTPGVRHVIGIASGKGGVGKSTVAVNLAVALSQAGARVGLLDADIYGPNVPLMTGLMGERPEITRNSAPDGSTTDIIEPVRRHGLKVMSMGFLLDEDQPVVWRGPMLNSALRQFLGQVAWGELDYLLVDLPPGTGDVQISLIQMARLTGVVHVTTPQDVALQDVKKGVAMFAQHNIRPLGVIENMSGFVCPCCGERTEIFGSGGGRRFAEKAGLPFLGEIPLDTVTREMGDAGTPVVLTAPESPQGKRFSEAAKMLVEQVAQLEAAV